MTSSAKAAPGGSRLILSEEGDCHLLGDQRVTDGELLELLTEGGWVSGHFRSRLHADSGYPVFEVHLGVLDEQPPAEQLEHAVIYLPPQAVLRKASAREPAALPPVADA